MSFMDKVKFWEKKDDFSFDDSSSGSFDGSSSDPFGAPNSGLPPSPSMSSDASFNSSTNNSSSSGFDPLAPSPGSAYDDSSSSLASVPLSDSFGGSNSTAQSSQSSQMSSDNSFNPSTSSQDPFARPSVPPMNNSNSVGKNLANKFIESEQSSSIPLNSAPANAPSEQLSPAKENELINLKLDAIRSEINAMSQRLIRLEHLIEEQNKKRSW